LIDFAPAADLGARPQTGPLFADSAAAMAHSRPDALLLVGVGVFVAVALVLAAASALLDTVRGAGGALAYLGLVGSLIAFLPLGDRYFTSGTWAVTAACLVMAWLLLGRLPLQSLIGAGAALEFGTHLRNEHPQQTAACAVLAVLLAASGFFRPQFGRGPSARGLARRPLFRFSLPRLTSGRWRWPGPRIGIRGLRRTPHAPRTTQPRRLTARTGYLGEKFSHIGRIAGSLFGWDRQYTRTGRPYQLPDLSIDEVRKVNTGYGTQQGSENCRKVSVGAVWRLFDRGVDLPGMFDRGKIGELEAHLGRRFTAYDDFDEIVRIMQEAGDGAVGIIAANKPAPIDHQRVLEQLNARRPPTPSQSQYIGHVFNAVNDQDVIQFLDFQGGKSRHARRWEQWGIIVVRGIDDEGRFIFHDFRK